MKILVLTTTNAANESNKAVKATRMSLNLRNNRYSEKHVCELWLTKVDEIYTSLKV